MLHCVCLCFISDDLEHNTNFVNDLQRLTCQYIGKTIPKVKSIEYFSDGCSGQYKNFKNFLNLCHHKEDFNFNAKWSFFTTKHGKSPCDGVGGPVEQQMLVFKDH